MVLAAAGLLLPFAFLVVGKAQQAGTNKKEVHVPVTFAECTKAGGCKSRSVALSMDAQWRWLHDAHPNMYGNCINGFAWDRKVAKDGPSGASFCALEGMDAQAYKGTYGVSAIPGGVSLNFKNGESIGSRLYMMEDTNTYMMYKLLNKEFTFDVDVSTLECGLNGAVYFVEMEADGGYLKKGNNTAGAKYGTGYCDAQCPHDLKFIQGEANVKDWHMTKVGPIGHYGACCSEMDIWEANKFATAYTAHPCKTKGPLKCEGDVCGDTPPDCKCCDKRHLETDCPCCGRYKGVCDKDGCDFNSYRLGDTSFYGEGPQFKLDTSLPMTIVTQFLTSDNTDTGDLVEIRRLYVQNGKVINNSAAKNLQGFTGDSITDELCSAQKKTFDNRDDFGPKGGLKEMGKAIGRGMVLVLSLWDDMLTKMVWLDSVTPTDQPERYPLTKPGVKRGPCAPGDGDPNTIRNKYSMSHVKYTNIMVGEIGSTYGPQSDKVRDLPATAMAETPAKTTSSAAASLGQQPLPGGGVLPGAPTVAPVAVVPSLPQTTAPTVGPVFTVAPTVAPMVPSTSLAAALTTAESPVLAPPTVPPVVAPTPPATSTAQSSPMCCTSAKDPTNACAANGCWPGSDMRTGFCVKDAASCAVCAGKWCPVAAPATPAVPAVVPAMAGATAPPAGGNPGCCSSASDKSNACGTCYPGSDITSGWCITEQDKCENNCGGTWCPNGFEPAQGFELPSQDELSEALAMPPSRHNAAAWLAVPALVASFPAWSWVRSWLRSRQAVRVDELELLRQDDTA